MQDASVLTGKAYLLASSRLASIAIGGPVTDTCMRVREWIMQNVGVSFEMTVSYDIL